MVHVSSGSVDDELREAVDAGVELANVLADGDRDDVRQVLVAHGFTRAPGASEAEIDEVARRFGPTAAIIATLPEAPFAQAVASVNTELAAHPVAPSLAAHDGAPLHIHWTATSATFGVQVAVDVLMALAHTLCDSGTERFGRCAAEGCGRLFYDATKNRSRRFCRDPRCASRTHTAHHRARQRAT